MSDEIALEASTVKFSSLVDGELRFVIAVRAEDGVDAVKYIGAPGTRMVIVPLKLQEKVTGGLTQVVKSKGKYGKFAQILDKNGFWMHPAVQALIGHDKFYQTWCRDQSCAAHHGKCPPQCWNERLGRFEIIYAHMNFSCNSGMRIKNTTADGLPLCDAAHSLIQHQDGDVELASVLGMPYKQRPTKEQAQEFLLNMCRKYRAKCAREVIKRDAFQVDSWAEVHPIKFIDWAAEDGIGVKHLIPASYFEMEV